MEKQDNDLETSTTTFIGIIIPAEWDASGNPLAVALSTYGEETHIVDFCTDEGKMLGRMIHKKVKVTGHVKTGENGKTRIFVQAYEEIETPPSLSPEEESSIGPP